MGIKPTFPKNLPLSVFELIIYQNTKTHPKHALWRKKNNITKNMNFESFSLFNLLKGLNTFKDPYIWETKGHLEKRVL